MRSYSQKHLENGLPSNIKIPFSIGMSSDATQTRPRLFSLLTIKSLDEQYPMIDLQLSFRLGAIFSLGLLLSQTGIASEPVPQDTIPAPTTGAETATPKSADQLANRVKALEEMVELMSSLQSAAPAAPAPVAAAPAARPEASNLDIALILDAAAAWFSQEALQTGAHDPSDTGFHLQQLEMCLGENVDHLFELKANLVFSTFGVEVEEAYGRTLSLPGGFQLKAGQFLTPMGRLNLTHPHTWSFVDQPLVNGTFLGSEGSRGSGVEVSWLSPLPWFADIVLSATEAAGECCARSFMSGDDLGIRTPLDLVYTLGLRQFFELSDDVGLAWGLTTQQGPNSTGNGNRTEIYGTDLYLRWRPAAATSRMALSWTFEGMMRRRQIPGGLRVDLGGYTQLVWNLNPSWEMGARYGYVSGSEGDDLIPEATEDRHRVSGQVTYRPSHFSRLRMQGSMDQPLYRDEPIWVGMLAVEFLVGAHGAHSY